MAKALDRPSIDKVEDPFRMQALLELISDQLMYASLTTPGLGSELAAKIGASGPSAFVVLADRIVTARVKLGLAP